MVLIRGILMLGLISMVVFFPGVIGNIAIGVFMVCTWASSELSAETHNMTIRAVVGLSRVIRLRR